MRILTGLAVAVLAACLSGPAALAATPRVTANERAQAAQQHPQIVAQFGGEVTGPVATYVQGVGEKVAATAQLPGQCKFTVINSDVVNAFAVPGCYIYVTRGLLAIMNSEDELASVLGHETGHVTGRHSAQRQTRGTVAGLGALAVGILTKNEGLAQLASQAGQLYTLSYSRNQEFEADSRGVGYIAGAGYNAYAAGEMLEALGANDALTARVTQRAAGSETPTWARTHPLTQDRVTRAYALAQSTGASRQAPAEKSRPYLQAIRGVVFGDDPEQGFVNGTTFSHPKLRISFVAPAGFRLTNTSSAVIISGPNSVQAQFAGGQLPAQGGLDAYAQAVLQKFVGQAPVQVGQLQRGAPNGVESSYLPARAQTQSGQIAEVAVAAYKVGDRAYHFVTVAPAGQSGALNSMLASFRTLNDSQVAALRERRIEIVEVRPGDTVQSLAQRMAFTDYQLDRFLALNGLAAGAALQPGALVKIVTFAR